MLISKDEIKQLVNENIRNMLKGDYESMAIDLQELIEEKIIENVEDISIELLERMLNKTYIVKDESVYVPRGENVTGAKECPKCKGTGNFQQISIDCKEFIKAECPICDGTGKVKDGN